MSSQAAHLVPRGLLVSIETYHATRHQLVSLPLLYRCPSATSRFSFPCRASAEALPVCVRHSPAFLRLPFAMLSHTTAKRLGLHAASAFAPAAFRVALPSLSVPRMNSEHRSASFGLSPWAYFPRLSFRFRRDVLYSRRLMGFICHQCSRAYLIAVEVLCLSHAFRVLLQCLSASRCPLRRSCPCAGRSASGCGIHPIAPSHFGPSLILFIPVIPFWRGSPCRGQLVFRCPRRGASCYYRCHQQCQAQRDGYPANHYCLVAHVMPPFCFRRIFAPSPLGTGGLSPSASPFPRLPFQSVSSHTPFVSPQWCRLPHASP